ncbi:MAG: 3-isopropylmalate dehydrogenase [candidate division Zixibacteria bacterium]|nr:3-isopropylmalate dehydrogenase [candidate division Zixibacteria bacterium]
MPEDKTYKFAVIAGDGIGPDVVREGLKVLQAAAEVTGFKYTTKEFPHGSEHFLSTGELFPDTIIDELKTFDAVYLGAIGDPRVEPGLVEHAIISSIRFKLDLYVNLRPIKAYADNLVPLKNKRAADIDFIVVRENTEDLYTNLGGIFKKGTEDEVAMAQMIFTRKGVERAIRYAFELARQRDQKKKLTLVDKANAIRAMDIWTRTFEEVAEQYPDIQTDHAYVDACCMWMIKDPEAFDVIVCNNIFGDIITDLGAMLQGGMGMAASGNIHPGRVSMFEPIHGSAPKYKGQDKANPIAAISAAAMMLDHVGENKAAGIIEGAIRHLLETGKIPDISASGGLSTTETGDMIAETIKEMQA